MAVDPRLVELFSYYRDAELRGAELLLRLLSMMSDDAEATVNLTRHVADETKHAWLWTKRITDMGGTPMRIAHGYQSRIGRRVVPRGMLDLLALTLVVEGRSLARYSEHAGRSDVDEATQRVLRAIVVDEEWHLRWMREKLDRLVEGDALARGRVHDVSERYRRIDEEVYRDILSYEAETFSKSSSEG